jgi:very-short-patch-repair endonuclease
VRVRRGVFAEGPEPPSDLTRSLAEVKAHAGVACGWLAGVLLGLDSVRVGGRPLKRRRLPRARIVTVDGYRCTDGLQTMIDLAAGLDDDRWEQALESALRRRLTSVEALERALPVLGRTRVPGTARIRRVLARRPTGAPPTESLLETLMVQLARDVEGLEPPTRQQRVKSAKGNVIARVDLCWPRIGLFLELDGEHHKDQPVHDSYRETAVVAATGWLCGRFTWTQVVHYRPSARRQLEGLVEQARRRPVVPPSGDR